MQLKWPTKLIWRNQKYLAKLGHIVWLQFAMTKEGKCWNLPDESIDPKYSYNEFQFCDNKSTLMM